MLRSRLIPLSLATVLAFGVGSLGTAFAAQSDLATGTMTAQASSASAEQVAPKAPAKSHAKKSSTSAHKSSKHSKKTSHAAKQPAESTGQKM